MRAGLILLGITAALSVLCGVGIAQRDVVLAMLVGMPLAPLGIGGLVRVSGAMREAEDKRRASDAYDDVYLSELGREIDALRFLKG